MQNGKDFTTFIEVDQSPEEVFAAINNVRGWWQGDITGKSEKLNDEFRYQMKEFHVTKQKVVKLVPGKRVVWQVTESSINFVTNKNEWLDTRIVFDIAVVNNKTRLTFTHEGLVPSIECYKGCSDGWSQLVTKSLFNFITKGKGVEVF